MFHYRNSIVLAGIENMPYGDVNSLREQLGIVVRPATLSLLQRRVSSCVACGKPAAPIANYATPECLTRWTSWYAASASARNENEFRRRQLHLGGQCAMCFSEIAPAFGLHDALLTGLLANTDRERTREALKSFIGRRLVFMICRECREDPSEDRISESTIFDRYRKTLKQMEPTLLHSAAASKTADEFFLHVTTQFVRMREIS
jgi:hypothetical protein